MDEQYIKEQSWKNILKSYKGRIITCTILIICIIATYIFISTHNAKSQIEQLEEDINQHHYHSLANTLSTKDKKMTKNEARQLVRYFEDEKHQKQLNQGIKRTKSNLKGHHESSNLGSINNEKNEPIISFTQDGKRFFFIDNISMKAHYRKVYVKEGQQPATYVFENHKKGVSNKQDISYVGEFIDGNYNVPTEKIFKDEPVKGRVHGHIRVNTTKRNKSNQIIANQIFNQTKIKVDIHNKNKFKDKDISIFINNHRMNGKLNQTFGYFPNQDPFKVYAEGQYKGHTFKTDKVDVMQDVDQSTQNVNLRFDEKAIQKTINNDKRDENKAGDFVKRYMEHLNDAYKETDYEPIKNDLAKGSKAEKFMKPKFKNKQDIKYHDVQVKTTKKQGNHIEVIISKKYKDNTIQTRYQVQQKHDDYKITDINDV